MIVVVDYGMGNLHSVAKALEHVAPLARVRVTQRATDILEADRVVFPGQGAIGHCMQELARLDLVEAVRRAAREKPFLGMCLGPQALMTRWDEQARIVALFAEVSATIIAAGGIATASGAREAMQAFVQKRAPDFSTFS